MEDLPFDFAQKTAAAPPKLGNYHRLMQENSRQYSRQLVLAALAHCRGNRSKAAMLLELSRAQFYKLAKMHGLDGEPADTGPQPDQSTEESDWMQ